ncbi:DMT family transporter [Candidatus Micrarchaeota archaeon]|nr:DMT family transporter [Candidatus Micrarchaeota archaeon]
MLDFLVFGIVTAIGWGAGDFLNARAARKTNAYNALVFSLAFASILWILFGLFGGHFRPLTVFQYVLALAAILLVFLGDFLFVSAAKSGKIAVASPLLALGGVVAMALGLLVLGERPEPLSIAFAGLAVFGGVLVGLKDLRSLHPEQTARVMVPAILAHGVAFTLMGVLIGHVGALTAASWMQAFMLVYLIPFAWFNRGKLTVPVVENGAVGIAYFFGYFAFAIAVSSGFVSIVAPIANLFPMIAVGLAVAVYGETLARHQWVGLFLAVLALFGLAL